MVEVSHRSLPWPLLLGGALMLGFLVGPLVALAGALPGSRPSDYLSSGAALLTSVLAATLATAADGLLGIPLGLWLARTHSRWRHAVTAGVLVPLALPPVVGGLVLVLFLGPGGWPGSLLGAAGLDPLDTLAGTVLAQMFVAAPFVVISARSAFAGVDPALEEAARSLGLGPAAALRRAVLPAARRGLATGLVLGWVRCLGEFGATAIVAYDPHTLPVLTYIRLTGEGLGPALPAAAILALTGGAAAALLLRLDSRRAAPQPAPGQVATGGSAWETGPASGIAWPSRSTSGAMAIRAVLRAGSFDLDVDFEVGPAAAGEGRTVALLGPSGAGKSLTLRVAAGLVRPAQGRVEIAGRVLHDSDRGVEEPPERRRLGYVAQRDALFDHLDVEGNVAFALRDRDQLAPLIAGLGLEAVRHARPRTLSGGERQRVALGRALAAQPLALVLDEPFSALDPPVRRELRRLVRRLQAGTGLSALLVTHDREDVLDLADQVVVMEAGRVVQAGAVEEVFARPATRSVAALVGIPNVVAVRRLTRARGTALVATAWGEWDVPGLDGAPPGAWELAVPTPAVVVEAGTGPLRVATSRPHPQGWLVEVENGAAGSLEGISKGRRPRPGEGCRVRVDGRRCHPIPVPRPGAAIA